MNRSLEDSRLIEKVNKIDTMTLKDLEGITPQDIEDYLEYVSTCVKDGITVESSSCTVTRRYSSLSSFFNYYGFEELPVGKHTFEL